MATAMQSLMPGVWAAGEREEALTWAAGYRCPHCKTRALIGAVVRVVHLPGCPRGSRASHRTGSRPQVRPQAPPRASGHDVVRPCAAVAPEDTASHNCRVRSRSRRRRQRGRIRSCYYSAFRGSERIRADRWFISGACVLACGKRGTARRLVGSGRDLLVAVVLDGKETAELFSLADLARAGT